MSSGVWSFITFHSSNINIKAPLNVWNPWFNVAIAVLILGTRNIKLFIQTHNTETDIISSNEKIHFHDFEYFLFSVEGQFVDPFSLLNMRLFYCPVNSLVTFLSGNMPWVSERQACRRNSGTCRCQTLSGKMIREIRRTDDSQIMSPP